MERDAHRSIIGVMIRWCAPNDNIGIYAGRIRDRFSEMIMVGPLQLILDGDLSTIINNLGKIPRLHRPTLRSVSIGSIDPQREAGFTV